MQSTLPVRRRPARRNGLIFGGVLAGLNLLNLILQLATGNYTATSRVVNGITEVDFSTTDFSNLLICTLFLITLALAMTAGLLAARDSGTVGAATIAGLLTGVLGTVLAGIVGVIADIAFVMPTLTVPPGSTHSLTYIQSLLVGTAILSLVAGAFINGALGAGIGALGGLIGRGQYRVPLPPQTSPYPGWPGQVRAGYAGGYPYQPYPPYPPQPYAGSPTYPPQPYPGYSPQPYAGSPNYPSQPYPTYPPQSYAGPPSYPGGSRTYPPQSYPTYPAPPYPGEPPFDAE